MTSLFHNHPVVFGAAVFASAVQAVPAGLAGLSITAAMQVTDMLSWMVRMSTEMEVGCGKGI